MLSCLRCGLSYFYKDPLFFFLMEMVFRNQDLVAWDGHCYWSVIASRSFQWTELGNRVFWRVINLYRYLQFTFHCHRDLPYFPHFTFVSLLSQGKNLAFQSHQYIHSLALTFNIPQLVLQHQYYNTTKSAMQTSEFSPWNSSHWRYILRILCLKITWILSLW